MTKVIEHRDLGRSLNDLSASPKPTSKPLDDVDYTDYRFEAARLNSFVDTWHVSHVKPRDLAAAGFYYTGETDKVRCFECRLVVFRWEESDNPWTQHQRWAPQCRFIRDISCGNVPIDVDPSEIPDYKRVRDVCGVFKKNVSPGHIVKAIFDDSNTPREITIDDLRSCHPEYASYEDRLSSFETWPKNMAQTKEQMANAGFFYTGKSDRTICYYCGGGLAGWESTDVPLHEHVKWFPKCKYINKTRLQEEESEKNTNKYIVTESDCPSHI